MCVKIQAVVRMFLVRSRRLQVLAKATSLDRVFVSWGTLLAGQKKGGTYTYAAKPARRDPAPNWIALGACERMRFAYREKEEEEKKTQGHKSFALSCPGEHMCVVLPVLGLFLELFRLTWHELPTARTPPQKKTRKY